MLRAFLLRYIPMPHSIRCLFAAVLTFAFAAACASEPADAKRAVVGPSETPTASAITVKPIVPPAALTLDYVLYLIDPPANPRPRLRTLIDREHGAITWVASEAELNGAMPMLWVDDSADLITQLPPYDAETLKYFGKDLSAAQIAQVASARHAIRLRFAHPASTAVESLARADRITLGLADAMAAFIDDTEARWMYSAASWKALRFTTDGSPRSDILAHVAIHSYRDGELIRSVSLGMRKFALPDVEMDGLSQSTGRLLGWIHNGILQRLREGQLPAPDGSFVFDVREIADASARRIIAADAFPNATWRGRFGLSPTESQEGDAANVLLTVSFDHFEGTDEHARRAAAAGQIMGWANEMKTIRHDEALEQASARARARLPALRKVFQDGLGVGERLLVKAPFATADGGQEWMWVEVTDWEQTRLRGILNNTPYNVPELQRGEQVEVNMDEVFDYQYTHADGTEEGGETIKVIEAMQGEVKKQGAP